jgi:hypothetical protein
VQAQPIRSSQVQPNASGVKMQLLNSPSDETFPNIEKALDSSRLMRYFPAAGKDKELAFRLYLWNCAFCESFHLSLHMAEIVCRNAIHRALLKRGDPYWFENQTFRGLLEDRFRSELLAPSVGKNGPEKVSRLSRHSTGSIFERF